MTGKRPDCSIVIRAYNEARHIGRLLEGIQQQSIDKVQIILVDSGSTDQTVQIARANGAEVVFIPPEEFTFGRSLNKGLAHARADLVVIASAHVYPVYPDWLEKLLAPFSNPLIGLAYGKQRGAPGTHFSESQVFQRWFPDEPQNPQDQPFCNNANAAIRRQLWEKRPYDESLAGLEDLDWAHWMLGQGYKLAYVPEAEIIHVHQERPRQVYNRYRREAMAFKRIFPQEQFHFWDFLRLFLSNASSDLWHAARQKQLGAHWQSIFWFRLAQFWGTYQGYRQSGPLTWQLRQTFYYPQGLRPAEQHGKETSTHPRIEPIQYNDTQKQG
jgi:glycosyltransferase involved in cell wall biosynthesis